MFARWQFEHGDVLSHRTLRVRHITQLRSFGRGASVVSVSVDDFAFFSEGKAEVGAPG